MQYTQRQKELNTQFQLGKDTTLENGKTKITFYTFQSSALKLENNILLINQDDNKISENHSFQYPVFSSSQSCKYDNAILLLHGLNERYWNKYLVWAEYLSIKTMRPVILFPIAFHMNRSPTAWSNPRALTQSLEQRRMSNKPDQSLSFANLTLSQRISEQPLRFYSSGRISLLDIYQLSSQLKNGDHELFNKNSKIDIFAYSIGAFLAEIALITDQQKLFNDSKLFLFCGGGLFNSMQGQSKNIMDKFAYEKLNYYYNNTFSEAIMGMSMKDEIYNSFNQMIAIDRNRTKREQFFDSFKNNLQGICLANDKVMPYNGIIEAMGSTTAESKIKQMDFPYSYCHENPFPIGAKHNPTEVDRAFNTIFNTASEFLSN